MLSIDNSTLSILYPTFAFLLKLPRLQCRGDADGRGVPRCDGVEKRPSRNFLPAMSHRLTGNTSHTHTHTHRAAVARCREIPPRFRAPCGNLWENFAPCPINGDMSDAIIRVFSRDIFGGSFRIYVFILPYSAPCHLLLDLDSHPFQPTLPLDFPVIVRRDLSIRVYG